MPLLFAAQILKYLEHENQGKALLIGFANVITVSDGATHQHFVREKKLALVAVVSISQIRVNQKIFAVSIVVRIIRLIYLAPFSNLK